MRDTSRWLARNRVRIGFITAVIALWLSHPTRRSVMAGAVVALIGEALRIWAAGHLEKGREITMSGPYRFTRHPLYLGSAVLGAGIAVAAASPIVAGLVAGYLGITLTSAIRSEESHLTDKFGGMYPAYREGRVPDVPRRFSFRRAIANREYRAVIGLVAALALLALKAL